MKDVLKMIKEKYDSFVKNVVSLLEGYNAVEIKKNNYYEIKDSRIGKLTFSIHEFFKNDKVFSVFTQFENKEKYNELFETYNTSSKHNFNYFDATDCINYLDDYLCFVTTIKEVIKND